jgi:hypothetical protein
VTALQKPLTTFTPGGFPFCIADLEFQEVACTGLVPNQPYLLSDGRERVPDVADASGTLVDPLLVHGGDVVALSNGSRILTSLHVAHLRVRVQGEETFLSGGRCQPGEYFAPALSAAPTTTAAGAPTNPANPFTGGVALTGAICPLSGNAAGLPSTNVIQTDELSGGMTETEVPDIQNTSPMEGETMYGHFTALAESGLLLPTNELIPTDVVTRIVLKIVTAAGAKVATIRNVDTRRGVSVSALVPGRYFAIWTLTDWAGDTRVVVTRFIEQRGRTGPGPSTRVTCRFVPGGRIGCSVRFPGNGQIRGAIRLRLTRGGTVAALGSGYARRGRVTITMPELTQPSSGSWQATLVLARPHFEPVTVNVRARVG